MLLKIIEAKYIQDYQIALVFNNGVKGLIDLANEFRGPVFQALKDPAYFKTFQLNRWTIEWDNGADLAPEFLYNLMLEQAKKSVEINTTI